MTANPSSAPIQRWTRLGRILAPDSRVRWLTSHTGASFPVQVGSTSTFELYVTGRDSRNRSLIGRATIDLADLSAAPQVEPDPVFGCGELGAFDENGVSYPFLVRHGPRLLMYYNGWMPSVLTPFQIHVGLAVQAADGSFERVSKAPVLERTDGDHLSMGSVGVLVEDGLWRMWYTSFRSWGDGVTQPKHVYVIKYAESDDGISWRRNDETCIDRASPDEFSICRPSVLRINGAYHMWYCTRGEHYRLGYAISDDGVTWTRMDDRVQLGPLDQWDGQAQAYPHVFQFEGNLYMLYCGNAYGRDGLGLAVLESCL